MEIKKLIKQLQEIDEKYGKEEELHVCCGNCDVSYVSCEPSYYDGAQHIVKKDEKGQPVSGKYKRSGSKVQIDIYRFNELLWDRKDFVIDYSELGEDRQKEYKENHDKIREASKNLDYKLELEHFTEYVKKHASKMLDDDAVDFVAKDFFDNNLSPYDKIPVDIPIINESYNTRREKQWDQQIKIDYTADGFHITKIIPT